MSNNNSGRWCIKHIGMFLIAPTFFVPNMMIKCICCYFNENFLLHAFDWAINTGAEWHSVQTTVFIFFRCCCCCCHLIHLAFLLLLSICLYCRLKGIASHYMGSVWRLNISRLYKSKNWINTKLSITCWNVGDEHSIEIQLQHAWRWHSSNVDDKHNGIRIKKTPHERIHTNQWMNRSTYRPFQRILKNFWILN